MSIETFALFTKALFDDSITTVLGRENYKYNDFTQDLIVCDELTPITPITNNEKFDGLSEIMTYSSLVNQIVTVDFYGDNAYLNATKYMALLMSQKATELKSVNKLTVYPAKTITHLTELVGSTYYKRYQLELNIMYPIQVDIETKRIDTPNMQFLIDK